jgi:hypothetical protein
MHTSTTWRAASGSESDSSASETRNDIVYEAFEDFEHELAHAKSLRTGHGYMWERTDGDAFTAATNAHDDDEFASQITKYGYNWWHRRDRWYPEEAEAHRIFEAHKKSNAKLPVYTVKRLYPGVDLSMYASQPLTKEEFT